MKLIDTSLHNHRVECQLLGSFSLDVVRIGPLNMHRFRASPFALAGLSCLKLFGSAKSRTLANSQLHSP